MIHDVTPGPTLPIAPPRPTVFDDLPGAATTGPDGAPVRQATAACTAGATTGFG